MKREASSNGTICPMHGTQPHSEAQPFFHGWLLVAALTLIMTMVYGASFSFSVFLKPLSEWFGWARTLTSGAYAISLWTSGLFAVLMGVLTDRYGPRLLLAIGGLLGGFGYLLLSGTSALWHLYAGFVVISINTSATWTPITATVSRWFGKKRALALGIVTAGIGLGQMLMPPLAVYLIEVTSWQTAYVIIAVMTWIIVIPAAIPARHPPQDMGLLPDGTNLRDQGSVGYEKTTRMQTEEWSLGEVVRTPAFWLLVTLNVLVAATLFMAGIHIVAHATDIDIPTTSAALIVTFMGAANILAKVVSGTIATKRGTKFTLLLFLVLETVTLFLFAIIRPLWSFFFVAALFGAGIGGAAPPLTAMVSQFFGLRSVGVIMGVIGVGWAAGCAFGTFLGDFIFDVSGSYVTAFLIAGGFAILVIILTIALKVPSKVTSSIR